MIFSKFKGVSMVELLLAMGIFVVMLVGGLGFIVTGQKASLMQSEYFEANVLAKQGIDVVRFLKKESWEGLSVGTFGISFNGTNWSFVPTSDLVDMKYTREISISDVYRDDLGNILANGAIGGEIDPSVKLVNVTVSWDRSGRVIETESSSYVSYWEQNVPTNYGGMLVYADYSSNDDILKYKKYSVNGIWSTEKTVPDFGVPENRDTRRLEVYASPTKDEYIVMTKHTEDGQFIYAQVYDGENWGHVVQLSGYGDNTNPNTRNFDGAYLSDGRFIAIYDDFTYQPKYRIWDGSNWSSQSTIGDLGILGYPVWMQVRSKPGSDNAVMVVRDALQRTVTFNFNGSSWGTKTTHGNYSSGFSIENVSIAWNRFSGNRFGLMFNEASDNNPNIRIWNDSTSSWGSSVENENVGGRAKIFELADDPVRDRFLGCVKDSNRTINCLTTGYTPSWSNRVRIASNTNTNEARSFSIGYESVSGELAVAVYSEGSTSELQKYPKYRTFDSLSSSWSDEMLIPRGTISMDQLSTVRVVSSPISDDIFVLMGDQSLDLYTVLWDGNTNNFSTKVGSDLKKHGIYGSNTEDFWYGYAWRVYEGE